MHKGLLCVPKMRMLDICTLMRSGPLMVGAFAFSQCTQIWSEQVHLEAAHKVLKD
jgi:hypothetical protein